MLAVPLRKMASVPLVTMSKIRMRTYAAPMLGGTDNATCGAAADDCGGTDVATGGAAANNCDGANDEACGVACCGVCDADDNDSFGAFVVTECAPGIPLRHGRMIRSV